jgi:hypothetical protein
VVRRVFTLEVLSLKIWRKKNYTEFTEGTEFAEKRRGEGEKRSGVNLGYGDGMV